MKTTFCFLTLSLLFAGSLNATTWHVGSAQTYTMPSQVSTLVNNGDTVDIDAGTYNSNVCAWTANNLLIRCKNGMAHLKSNGLSYGDKAIWVIQGNNTTIEHIEFSLCTSTSANGAGIRQEGKNLTVRYCYFHDNENGILSGALAASKITVEYSEFNLNGAGDGYSHNLYIGHIDTLLFRYNYSHHCKVGHELKSRANVNYILYNRFTNEATGTASYEVDLPNGGMAIVMGNVLQKSTNANNSNMVSYGVEGLTNAAPHNFYLINNTLVNERSTGTFVNVFSGTNLYKAYNNILAGNGNIMNGSPVTIDTVANKKYTIAAAGFSNSATYDYHLLAGSSALNAGVNAGNASNGFALTPIYEYVHPSGKTTRAVSGALDAGAFELLMPVSVKTEAVAENIVVFYPEQGYLNIRSDKELSSVRIMNLEGKLIYENKQSFTKVSVSIADWPAGIYIVSAVSTSGVVVTKKCIVP